MSNSVNVNSFIPGDRVKLNRNIKVLRKVKKPETCYKCDGEKTWVNAYDSSDVRDCLTCKGKGFIERYVIDEVNGKRSFVSFKKDTVGVIESFRAKGKFNSGWAPSIENIEVTVITTEGVIQTSCLNVDKI